MSTVQLPVSDMLVTVKSWTNWRERRLGAVVRRLLRLTTDGQTMDDERMTNGK